MEENNNKCIFVKKKIYLLNKLLLDKQNKWLEASSVCRCRIHISIPASLDWLNAILQVSGITVHSLYIVHVQLYTDCTLYSMCVHSLYSVHVHSLYSVHIHSLYTVNVLFLYNIYVYTLWRYFCSMQLLYPKMWQIKYYRPFWLLIWRAKEML